MKKANIHLIVTVALMVALHIILSRFLSINAWNLKIGFSFVPVFAAAVLYGPLVAGLVGALGDFLGAILFPIGPYFPGFTLTCCLTGLAFGLLLYKKQTVPRIAAATAVNQLVIGLLVNSYWISMLYGSPYGGVVAGRIIQCAILIPVEFLVMGTLTRVLFRRLKENIAA